MRARCLRRYAELRNGAAREFAEEAGLVISPAALQPAWFGSAESTLAPGYTAVADFALRLSPAAQLQLARGSVG